MFRKLDGRFTARKSEVRLLFVESRPLFVKKVTENDRHECIRGDKGSQTQVLEPLNDSRR